MADLESVLGTPRNDSSLYQLHNGVNRVYLKGSWLDGTVLLARGVIRLDHLIRRNGWSNAARPSCVG